MHLLHQVVLLTETSCYKRRYIHISQSFERQRHSRNQNSGPILPLLSQSSQAVVGQTSVMNDEYTKNTWFHICWKFTGLFNNTSW
jgi:hypothetical protein